MNALDAAILIVVAAAAWGGYRLGFVARTVSWIGMAAGLALALVLLPLLLTPLEGGSGTTVVAAGLGVVLFGALGGQALGLLAGDRLRLGLRSERSRRLDSAAGAVVAAAGVLAMVWIVLPAAARSPSWPNELARTSAVRRLLPDPPETFSALERLVGSDRFPRIIDSDPTVAGPAPLTSGIEPDVVRTAARSVVHVSGTACERLQQGTGSVVADELVVTNAHVVAGVTGPTVVRDDGEELAASLVGFDPGRDLAFLVVPGLDRPGLERRAADEGEVGAVLGHPGGGRLEVSPARIDRELVATGADLYGDEAPPRDVLLMAAALEPGDSGAPLIGSDGALIGVAFAVASGEPEAAYALALSEIERAMAGIDPTAPVADTACAR